MSLCPLSPNSAYTVVPTGIPTLPNPPLSLERVLPRDLVSITALIAANLVPLAGVIWLGWNVTSIMVLYWMENLIIGFYSVLKIVFHRFNEPGIQVGKFFQVPFFCAHYGGFCAMHGLFLQLIFNVGGSREAIIEASLNTSTWPLDIVSGRLFLSVAARAWKYAPEYTGWMLAGLLVSHGISFIQNYLGQEEYSAVASEDLMSQPYKRILFLHGALLCGGILAMALGTPAIVLVALIAIKIGVDIQSHIKSHRAVPAPVVNDQPAKP